MKLKPAVVAALCMLIAVSGAVWAQNRPFPQHTTSTVGTIRPNSLSQSALDDSVHAHDAAQKINAWMKTQAGGDPSLIRSGYKLNGAIYRTIDSYMGVLNDTDIFIKGKAVLRWHSHKCILHKPVGNKPFVMKVENT